MYQLNLKNIIILLIKLENSVSIFVEVFYYEEVLLLCVYACIFADKYEGKHIILYRIRLDNIECQSG